METQRLCHPAELVLLRWVLVLIFLYLSAWLLPEMQRAEPPEQDKNTLLRSTRGHKRQSAHRCQLPRRPSHLPLFSRLAALNLCGMVGQKQFKKGRKKKMALKDNLTVNLRNQHRTQCREPSCLFLFLCDFMV